MYCKHHITSFPPEINSKKLLLLPTNEILRTREQRNYSKLQTVQYRVISEGYPILYPLNLIVSLFSCSSIVKFFAACFPLIFSTLFSNTFPPILLSIYHLQLCPQRFLHPRLQVLV